MIGRTFLVARKEYLQYVATRGFIFSVLMFPVWLSVGAMLPGWIEGVTPVRHFAVIDRAGGYVQAIDEALLRDRENAARIAVFAWAKASVDLTAARATEPELVTAIRDVEGDVIERIGGFGGAAAVAETLTPYLRAGAEPFVAPPPRFVRVEAPGPVATSTDRTVFSTALKPYLGRERLVSGPDGEAELFAVAEIPAAFGASPEDDSFGYWPANVNEQVLAAFLARAITDAWRLRVAAEAGLGAESAQQVFRLNASIERFDTAREAGADALTREERALALVPVGFAFLLILAIFSTANVLLMSVIEEKSNRIVEVVLSCMNPTAFMAGKLLGALGIAFTMLGFWLIGSLVALLLLNPSTAAIAGGALAIILSAEFLPWAILYFVAAFLIFATMFLAVGSMASGLTEAQSWLGPLMLIVSLPIVFLFFIWQDPNGPIATVLSWIPIYTPVIMMARIPSGVPAWELAATTVLMLVTVAALLRLTGAVFSANVLTSDRPPSFGEAMRRLFRRA